MRIASHRPWGADWWLLKRNMVLSSCKGSLKVLLQCRPGCHMGSAESA